MNLVTSVIMLPVAVMINQYYFTFCFHEEMSKSFPIEHIAFVKCIEFINYFSQRVTRFNGFIFSETLPRVVVKFRFLFLSLFFLNFACLYVIVDRPGLSLPPQPQNSAQFTREMPFETYASGLKFSFRFEQKRFMRAWNVPLYVVFGVQGKWNAFSSGLGKKTRYKGQSRKSE